MDGSRPKPKALDFVSCEPQMCLSSLPETGHSGGGSAEQFFLSDDSLYDGAYLFM